MKPGERMNPGDLVRVIHEDDQRFADRTTSYVWHEFMGQFGMIVSMAKRLHIPAARVLVKGEIAEFDLDELECSENDEGW